MAYQPQGNYPQQGGYPPAGYVNPPPATNTTISITTGQASYGQPGQVPYGQPGQAPYGQPGQAPYGQPGQAPYSQPGQAPYGQPGQAPYGQPGQAPYGGQPTGQAPYGQPGQAPYSVKPAGQAPYSNQFPASQPPYAAQPAGGVTALGPFYEGFQCHLHSLTSNKNVRIAENGDVNALGEQGGWATFHVHVHTDGTVLFQNHQISAHWLRIHDGIIDGKGSGGGFCNFRVLIHPEDGTISLQSAKDPNAWLGFAPNGFALLVNNSSPNARFRVIPHK